MNPVNALADLCGIARTLESIFAEQALAQGQCALAEGLLVLARAIRRDVEEVKEDVLAAQQRRSRRPGAPILALVRLDDGENSHVQ